MINGYAHADYAPVHEAFEGVLAEENAGAALAVVRNGETVVDLWGGRDPLSGDPWREDSVTLTFSVAKGIMALLVARCVQEGLLDPSAPVASYWPEFAGAGKESITVADVLTHVAGLPALPIESTQDVLDPDLLARRFAQTPPAYPPRTMRTYHILSYGLLAGELVRRVTGRDAAALLQERVAGPLGASLWLGTPPSADSRFLPVLMEPGPPPVPAPPADAAAARVCEAAQQAADQITPLFAQVDGRPGSEPVNSPEFRRALVHGGGLVADARSLARVYGACVAPVDGVRLLADETVALVSRDWLGGIPEPVCSVGAVPTTRWGLGFEISHDLAPMMGEGSFGHAGMGGRLAFAHAPSRTGFAFVGQTMRFAEPGREPRWQRLMAALAEVTPG